MRLYGAAVVTGWMMVTSVFAAGEMPHSPAAKGTGGHDHAAMMGMSSQQPWTIYPALKTMMSRGSGESSQVTVVPQHIVAANIDVYSSNLKDENYHRQLQAGLGGSRLDMSTGGGFNWLTAHEEFDDLVRVASTVYYSGERGAKDPTAMFMLRKNELEIIPQPYPREHSSYRANENWKFLVRFNGKPLPAQSVFLETSNGSMREFVSDAQGTFTVQLPDDFKPEEINLPASGHNHARRVAELVLGTEYDDGGKTYLTAFNSSYGPNAFDKRSVSLGLGFVLLGVLGAVPLLSERRGTRKSREQGNV